MRSLSEDGDFELLTLQLQLLDEARLCDRVRHGRIDRQCHRNQLFDTRRRIRNGRRDRFRDHAGLPRNASARRTKASINVLAMCVNTGPNTRPSNGVANS